MVVFVTARTPLAAGVTMNSKSESQAPLAGGFFFIFISFYA